MNQISLIGNVGRTPELSYTPNGTAVCKFTMAVNYKRNGVQEPTWFNVAAFGKQAETLDRYLSKGAKLFVQGRLTIRDYTDKTGAKRQWVEVALSNFEFLSSAMQEDDNEAIEAAPEPESSPF